jgi:hypothetical protein
LPLCREAEADLSASTGLGQAWLGPLEGEVVMFPTTYNRSWPRREVPGSQHEIRNEHSDINRDG